LRNEDASSMAKMKEVPKKDINEIFSSGAKHNLITVDAKVSLDENSI